RSIMVGRRALVTFSREDHVPALVDPLRTLRPVNHGPVRRLFRLRVKAERPHLLDMLLTPSGTEPQGEGNVRLRSRWCKHGFPNLRAFFGAISGRIGAPAEQGAHVQPV